MSQTVQLSTGETVSVSATTGADGVVQIWIEGKIDPSIQDDLDAIVTTAAMPLIVAELQKSYAALGVTVIARPATMGGHDD